MFFSIYQELIELWKFGFFFFSGFATKHRWKCVCLCAYTQSLCLL